MQMLMWIFLHTPLKPKQRSHGEFIVVMPKLASPWQQAVNSAASGKCTVKTKE